MVALLNIITAGIISVLVIIFGYIYEVLVLKPTRVRSKFEVQGIKGPPISSVFLGNIPQIIQIKTQHRVETDHTSDDNLVELSHDWPSRLLPHLKLWQQQYGPMFIYSTGSIQMLSVSDPSIVKEILVSPTLDLGKPAYLSKDRGPLLGQGVITSSGSFWAYQRKLIAPELFPNKIKDMVGMMVEATNLMLKSWEEKICSSGQSAEIAVDEDLRSLSQDIISKAAFGSDYTRGKHIFEKMRILQELMAKTVHVGVPGSRYMPTKSNWMIKKLEKEIYQMILSVINERKTLTHETDFLQKILEGAKLCTEQSGHTQKVDLEKLIVDNCKNIYFAGHETVASAAAWTLMLLAAYPDWQARARAEVSEVCQDDTPTVENLRNMKVMTMIIQESLRLYPPAVFVTRTAQGDAKLNGVVIPKGMDVQFPVLLLHHDPELWGLDVQRFNPDRFANGIAAACKVPQAFMPFGFGARVCLGQHFAMVELKVILSLILSQFRFTLSAAYKHSPAFRLVIEPEYGVKLLLEKV